MALVQKNFGAAQSADKPVYAAKFRMPPEKEAQTAVDPYKNSSSGAGQAADPTRGSYGSLFSPGSGQGKDFTIGRQYQAVEGLRGSLTDAEEGDYANRSALRNALSGQISQYGGAADAREQNFMGNQERGLARNLAQMRRQMGGTGLAGSSQQNRSLGDILAGSQRETGQGLNQLQLQKGQELNQLAAGNQANLAQGLMERGFNLEQASTLANLLQRQAEVEQGSILGTRQPIDQGPSDFDRGLGYMLQMYGISASSANSMGGGGGGGGGGGAGMAAMAASDVRVKENIEPGSASIESFLKALTPHTYDYTDMAFGVGRHTSVMAQDLEASEIGKSFIVEKDGVKHVDYGKAFGAMLATIVHLNQKIERLERGKNAEL